MSTDRLTELALNLAEVSTRVEAACIAANRVRSEVQLLAVTKTFPATDLDLLALINQSNRFPQRPQLFFGDNTIWERIWLHWTLLRCLHTCKNGNKHEGEHSNGSHHICYQIDIIPE
jgi:hypothetical protein